MSAISSLAPFWTAMRRHGVSFDDFHFNGVLLPATETIAAKENLPLHRGPHREYSDAVGERVGAIESSWARGQSRPAFADCEAAGRLRLLQKALRRRLSREGNSPLTLNRRDPVGHGIDFGTLDAMAEQLWSVTAYEDPDRGIATIPVCGKVG
ncbi:AHH domain-containing protein [uncultured Croceicoccus sp.]|uniref:AHH domain-containing protein n=1 Tax=uncultured Croceicoccus sp. TaxID=1295329 RepID=UPI00344D97A3